MSKSNYEETGIKTSIFYCLSKLSFFPRLIKARPAPINVKERQNKAKNRSGNLEKRSQKSIQKKKLGMSSKRDSKRKLCETTTRNNVKGKSLFSDGKANDIGSLQTGKRSSFEIESEEYQQDRCKKIKLDINKNIESDERIYTQSEFCGESEFKSQNTDTKTEELDSQGSTICLSSSPNLYDSDLTTERGTFDTKKSCEIDHFLGISSSSKGSRSKDGTNPNNERLNNSLNMKSSVNEQKEPISNIFGTPSFPCLDEDRFKNDQINVKRNGSPNVSDNASKIYQREQAYAINQNEYYVRKCTLSLPCSCENSLKGSGQNNAKLDSSPIGNEGVLTSDQREQFEATEGPKYYKFESTDSSSSQSEDSSKGSDENSAKINSSSHGDDNVLTCNQREPFDAMEGSDYNIFGSTANSSQNENSLKRAAQNTTKLNRSTNGYIKDVTSSQREPVKETKEYKYDILGSISTSSSKSEDRLKRTFQKNAKSRSPRKKMGSLDAFLTIENARTSMTKEKPKESGFHESFRILGELSSQEGRSCSSTNSSPLLFSQKSTSSVCSGLSKTKSSPDSQSSIMKYFTPLGKSPSLSPILDKKRKVSLKGRKATLPSGSPVNSKKEQMFLDLGQKNFGHVTCPTCHMVYTTAQPEDEAHHVKFHHKVVSGLRFRGWKSERVVEHFDDGRVIVVLPHDPPSHLKKVESVRLVVDDELGFSSETSQRMQDCKTYMFIADKRVVGCVVAVAIQKAFPLIQSTTDGTKNETLEQGAWCCSSEPVRAQCGISRIWVLKQYRRNRIASRILDCVRSDFMFGGVVAKELLAFSDPTPLGKQLAESYCGTENFLVFR